MSEKSPVRSASPVKEEGPRQSAVEKFISEGPGVKVNVRNLPWSVTEEELKSQFSAAGEIVGTIISKRGTRSLGYGFVSFATKEQADKAVADFDKTNMGDREIKVLPVVLKTEEELAALKEKRGERLASTRAPRGGRRGRRGARGGSKRSDDDSRVDGEKSDSETKPAAATNTSSYSRGGRGRRGDRGARRGGAPRGGSQRPAESENESKFGPKDFDHEKSVYVGNLPWSVKDEELASVFAEFKPLKAHVPCYGYNSNRSKGYGLLEFASADARDKFLNDVDSVTVDGRQLKLEKGKPYRGNDE